MFGLKLFKVLGHSMEPFIKAGSFVLVWCWSRSFKIGDVIAFRYDNKILIKRVAAIKNNQVEIRGDNKTDSLDSRQFGSITETDIIGKVCFH